jgi:pyruvate dehydrogenase E2 component (dihydrolipoamide acetyltransferase)
MSVSVSMPQLGESVTEGTVTRWLKREGERVEADEPLLEVSTDKVDTEIPSPVSGVVRGITVAEDETVAVGAELAVIDEDGAAPGDGAPAYEQPYPEPAAESWSPPPAYEQPPAAAEPAIPPQAAPGPAEPYPAAPSPAQPQPAAEPQVAAEAVVPPQAAPPPAPEAVAPPQPAPEQVAPPQPAPEPEPPAPQVAETQVAETQVAETQVAETQVAEAPLAAEASEPSENGARLQLGPESPYVTPLVRKLASEHGIDLSTVPGTGVGGRIRKQDVLEAARALRGAAVDAPQVAQPSTAPVAPPAATAAAPVASPPAAPAAAAPPVTEPPVTEPPVTAAPAAPVAPPAPAAIPGAAPAAPAAPPPVTAPKALAREAAPEAVTPGRAPIVPSGLRGRTERLSRSRQVIAQRMMASLQTSAQLTTVVEADVTEIARIRDRARGAFEAREGVRLSFLPFFALATVEALKVHPALNAFIDTASGQVTYHDAEHLGIAVDTERGLMVPVIRKAGDLNIAGLARKIADLAERTRSGQVSPDELSGGTFTLTNTGSRGALFDTPIINQPQVGILGTGAVVRRPVVVEDPALGEVIAVRSMVYLALTYDHRLVDGADAARFLGTLKARLEEGAFEAELGL